MLFYIMATTVFVTAGHTLLYSEARLGLVAAGRVICAHDVTDLLLCCLVRCGA